MFLEFFLAFRIMSKDLKRAVLYEVIQKQYDKVPFDKKSGPARSAKSAVSKAANETDDANAVKQKEGPVKGQPKSRILGLPVRKRGPSIRYLLAGLLVFAAVLGLLLTVNITQFYEPGEKQVQSTEVEVGNDYAVSEVPSHEVVTTDFEATQEETVPTQVIAEQEKLRPAGDHVIVIATYKQGRDLVPVKEYFDQSGIKTEIQERGDYYFLVTKNKFRSPKRTGTDGYTALQRIKQVGVDYEAPPGYESFAPNLFQDAYGMKIR